LTDSSAVKPPAGRGWRRRTNSTSPISSADWITKPEKPADRYAPLPVLGVMAAHIVPYGLAYPVKKVRSERKSVRDTTMGIRASQERSAPAGWASPARSGPVIMRLPPSARTRWLGLMRPSTPSSIPKTTCHSMSARPPTKKMNAPARDSP
jgi:hypothetical protein